MADHFVRCMHLLMSDCDDPVHILMNSGGGHWLDALAIYDCIRDADTLVTIEVLGKCMSAAVPIVQACEKRFIHPNATVMVHNGSHEASGVDALTLEQWGKNSTAERKRMYAMLAARSPKDAGYWRRKCAQGDFYMTASQAVELGLFDTIVERL